MPFTQVLDWLEDDLELGGYRREFARAKVDGALLLNLEVSDLWPLKNEKQTLTSFFRGRMA